MSKKNNKNKSIQIKDGKFTITIHKGGSEHKELKGAGGGKGGGGGARSAIEAPNTLRSAAVVRVLDVIGEGEIVGIPGGARGIYINGTPLVNSSGGSNFPRSAWAYRVGLPDQPAMNGFGGVEAETMVGSPVIYGSPVTRTTSDAAVGAVRITIQLPQGLYSQDVTNGDLNGASVSFRIETKATSSGAWTWAQDYTISGKTTTPYERQFGIGEPAAGGTFDWRVTRLTADSNVASTKDAIAVSRVTEIQYPALEVLKYNNTAYVALEIDAETVGNQIPNRSYLVKGVKLKVPTNYNTTTRAYTGIWDGTFKIEWSDNPAWVLYDLLTNERYGLGEFISESQIDAFSFYDAAVYSDELVPSGVGFGTEPRFTFNAVLASREEAFGVLQQVAGSMRATLVYQNGLLKVLQDRPSDPIRLITNANVINGRFTYRGTSLFERHTGVNVTFNDRADRHLQRITTVDASTTTGSMKDALEEAQNIYGYNPVDVAAFGATTEGQAIRHGRWLLDTEINQTMVGQWQMSVNGFDLEPNDIVLVYDEHYTDKAGSGRIIEVDGTTVTIDRPVELVFGSTIQVQLADGVTIEERNIVETSGTTDTFTIDEAFSQDVLPYADYILVTTAQPRQFKILAINQGEDNNINIEAVEHDPNKYSRVETGIDIPAPIFSNATPTTVNAPTGLVFREVQVVDANDGLAGMRRSLVMSWLPPSQGVTVRYVMRYRVGLEEWINEVISAPTYTIEQARGGNYEVSIYGISLQGNAGPSLEGSYSINTNGGSVSVLHAPEDLEVIGGGSTYTGFDLNFQWRNSEDNAEVETTTLRDFEVKFIDTVTTDVLRIVYVAPVSAGALQTFSYPLGMSVADGGPRRSVQVQVRCRDTNSNLSDPATVTFSNPVPAAIEDITATPGIGNVHIRFNRPTDSDVKGIMVWRSETSSFSPSEANLHFDSLTNSFVDIVPPGTTYYYKLAGYDDFSKPLDGDGLNVSAEFSSEALPTPGIPEVDVLPDPVGYDGPAVVFLSTDQKLYSYEAGEWSLVVPGDDTISADMLKANSVVAGKLAASAVETDNLAAGAVVASKINVTELSAISGDLGTITAGEAILGASPAISGTSMTGAGLRIYGDGRFALGTSSRNIVDNGTDLYLNGFTQDVVTSVSVESMFVFGGSAIAGRTASGPTITTLRTGSVQMGFTGFFDIRQSGSTLHWCWAKYSLALTHPTTNAVLYSSPYSTVTDSRQATPVNGTVPRYNIPASLTHVLTGIPAGTYRVSLQWQFETYNSAGASVIELQVGWLSGSYFGREIRI